MAKIKCGWVCCKYNSAKPFAGMPSNHKGLCMCDEDIELEHAGDNEEGENCMICSNFKWVGEAHSNEKC